MASLSFGFGTPLWVLQPVALPGRSAGCPTGAVLSHTAFSFPVKWHSITHPSCSFSRAARNQFSGRSQLSGALGQGGGDMAPSACPAGTERSIPKTLATPLLFILIQHPRQQARNPPQGRNLGVGTCPPLLAPLLTLSAAVRRVHGLSALRS